jgi:serine/threonine-protein kinase RsbW
MADHRLALSPDIAEIPRLLDWVEACCAAAGIDEGVTCKMTLALEEAVANAINHGFGEAPPPHRVEVALTIDADRVCAEVIDNGKPFNPLVAPEPDKTAPLEARDPGGLGIHLIRKMVDRADYRRVGDENRLLLEKNR